MASRKRGIVPKKGITESEERGEARIVLRPVDLKWETASPSSSRRPKRSRKRWDSRSPSPSPPRSNTRLVRLERTEESDELDVIVKDEERSGEVENEGTVKDPFLIEDIQQEDGCQEVLEVASTSNNSGQRRRSKAQLWQLICTLASEELFQKWLQEAGKFSWAHWLL